MWRTIELGKLQNMGKGKARNLNISDPSGGSSDANGMPATLKKISEKLDEQSEQNKVRHEELTAKMELLIEENRELKTRVSKLETVNNDMAEEIHVLKEKVNDLYQEKIVNNIIIKNVPEVPSGSEDLFSLFKVLCGKIGVPVQKTFYVDAYRMGKKSNGKMRPIVFKLSSNKYKVDIIKAKRKNKIFSNTLTIVNDDGVAPLGSPEQEIYIDEHLTRDNMHLFMEARRLRGFGYKYIWSRNGNVFVKASDMANVTKVSGMGHLKQMVANILAKRDPARKRKDISASTEKGSPDDPFKNILFDSPERKRMNTGGNEDAEANSDKEAPNHTEGRNMSVS